MEGIFSDIRKTAIAAGMLIFVAMLFVQPGGVGDSAADHPQELIGAIAGKGAKTAEVRRTGPSPAQWFSETSEDEPGIAAPSGSGPAQPVRTDAELVAPPPPAGADFPPGLNAPRYSSSAAGP